MPTTDPRIDAYIAKAQPFARPILARIRKAVHAGCPDVVETIKWSVPAFEYKGPLCGMAAFKAHCLMGFWKGALLKTLPKDRGLDAEGNFGRFESVDDLPSETALARAVSDAADAERPGRQSAEDGESEEAIEGPGLHAGRDQEEQEGAGDLRRLQPVLQARIHRVDHRRENGRDSRPPPRNRRAMDG